MAPGQEANAVVPQVQSAVSSQNTVPQVPDSQTLFIGDSITAGWVDEPIHFGEYGYQACVIRLALGTAIAQNPNIRRVVIEAGTNDIINGPGIGLQCFLPNQAPVTSILDMIKTAQMAGKQIFVLSVLPISWNNSAGQPCDPLVPPFNATLKSAITAAGATWVDDYDAFNGHTEYQIDGVHPNETGYHVMETVYAATACAAAGCTAVGTQTSLSASALTIQRPASGTLTATVTPAGVTGMVNFYQTNNGNLLASAPVNAQGVASVAASTAGFTAGTYPVFAKYMGDSGHLISFSPITNITLQ